MALPGQDDCDAAAAEEMVCALMLRGDATGGQQTFVDALKALLERDDFVWRGVYDDRRFDRHARGYVRRLMRMVRANDGWANLRRYQRWSARPTYKSWKFARPLLDVQM